MRRVIVAGPFPPPMHGLAYITQQMSKLLGQKHTVEAINLAPPASWKGLFYHLQRVWLTQKGTFTLMRHRFDASRAFYTACQGGFGLIYTIKLASIARLLYYPIYIHHHSFAYIEKMSPLMAALLRIAGREATHIFLCDTMAQRFTERYNTPIKSLVISNAAFVEPAAAQAAEARPLTIGLLSNLNDEKGLSAFLNVLREAKHQNMPVKAILAGPTPSDIERDLIAVASAELGAQLEYRGAVYGADKDRFFRDIDVFVFPTRYVHEAEPTVVFEALAHGIPVLSYDRGCICTQVKNFGATLPRDEPFTNFAVDWLRDRLADPEAFAQLRLDARAAFAEDHARTRLKAALLLTTPATLLKPEDSK